MATRASRILALLGGLALAVAGGAWAERYGAEAGLYRYTFEDFRQLAPGEPGFYLRQLLVNATAGGLLAFGLLPWASRWFPARSALLVVAERALPPAAAVITALLGYGVLRDAVVTDDEWVYLFQSRMLAAGRASLPAPADPEFWSNAFVLVKEGRWFGQYPPGHAAALLPGMLLGLPRWVPIVLAAVNVALVGSILRRWFGRGWSVAGMGLLAASPLFLLTGATLLSHSTAFFALCLAARGTSALYDRDGAWAGAAWGGGLGILLLTRPFTGVTLGAVLGVLGLVAALRGPRPRALAVGAAAVVSCLALFLLYNWGATGHPLRTGYVALRGAGQVELGFGTIVAGMDPHTPVRGLGNVAILGLRFLLWAFGTWLLTVPLVLARTAGRARPPGRGATPRDAAGLRTATRSAWSLVIVGLLGYAAYWSVGVNDTGPVKAYELLLPWTVLLVAALRGLAARWGPGAAGAWALAGLVVAALAFWPGRIQHLESIAERVRLPYREVERVVEPPAVVFTANVQPTPPWSWVFGRPNPSPGLDDPILYVRDGGPANADFMRRFPGRRPYRLDFEGREPRVTPLFRMTPRSADPGRFSR